MIISILKAILWFPLNMLIITLGIPILAITLPFIPRSAETLPRAIRWFDNAEIPLKVDGQDDGLLGPPYYRAERGTSDKESISYLKLYWERFYWLALRNPAHYFGYKYLGFIVHNKLLTIDVKGDINVGDHAWNTTGTYYVQVRNGDKGPTYFELYSVYQWFSSKYYIRFRFGWKLHDPSDKQTGEYVSYVCSLTPFKELLDR